MINLLPLDAKKQLARERFGRLLFVYGLAMLAIFFSGSSLMFLAFVSLNLQKGELSRELEAARKSPTLARVEEVEASIKKTNERLRVFSRSLDRENRISQILIETLKHRQSTVSLEELTFNGPSEFRLKGVAGTRDDLLAFTKLLSGSDLIAEVNSPISNLLKDRNVGFSLSFTVLPDIISETVTNRP